jgi:hypothetical protein
MIGAASLQQDATTKETTTTMHAHTICCKGMTMSASRLLVMSRHAQKECSCYARVLSGPETQYTAPAPTLH